MGPIVGATLCLFEEKPPAEDAHLPQAASSGLVRMLSVEAPRHR